MLKPYVRMLYAHIPGIAAARFAAKDVVETYWPKQEFRGIELLNLGGGDIIDIGAYRGNSITAFKKYKPRSRIVAFEPDPRSSTVLVNRFGHDKSISIYTVPLGSFCKPVSFYLPKYGRWNCDGRSATTYTAATEWLYDKNQLASFNRRKLTVTKKTFMSYALDYFKLAPSLIKVHAQGAEFDILHGAQNTIQKYRPVIMCAFAGLGEADDLLCNWGYTPHTYIPHTGNGASLYLGVASPPTTFTWYLP